MTTSTNHAGAVTPRKPPPETATEPALVRKIDLGDQCWPASHRSGWAYALHALGELHAPGGVLLDGFVEKKFAWGTDPGDRNNNPRPHARPWVGFWHNPPHVPEQFNAVWHAPADILDSWLWRESMPHCRGLFTLSEHLRRWLAPPVPVEGCCRTARAGTSTGADRPPRRPRRLHAPGRRPRA